MIHVAIATCRGVDVDPDSPLLLDAFARRGVEAQLAVWDADVDWGHYDLVVIRSTWDYTARRAQFLTWARSLARVLNPYEVLEYSSDKHYLADVGRHHRVVTSTFCDVGDEPRFPEGDFVVKPCVGAGSLDVDRYRSHDHERAVAHVARLHAHGRDALIQPYVTSVDVVGERALVFIDGAFSHAMTKGAMLNVAQLDRNALFRREQMSRATPEPDAVDFAESLLTEAGFADLLYARVDLVNTEHGWALMELELVEPSLFLSFDGTAADRLVDAVIRRLD